MDITSIEYFLQLAKYNHVSKTADFLNITQSALSRSISALENELGVKLFDRSGKKLRLNKSGEEFAKYAAQSMASLQQGIEKAQKLLYEYEAYLYCGLYTYCDTIQPMVIEYSRLNPMVSIEMGQRIPAKTVDDEDFIFYSLHGAPANIKRGQHWISVPLRKERYKLFISPTQLKIPKEQESIDLSVIKDMPFIVSRGYDMFARDLTNEICWFAGFAPKIYMTTTNFIMKIRYIDAGLAASIMPESCEADAKLIAPDILVLDIENYDIERTVSVMRKRKSLLTETALDFWEYTLGWFGVSDASDD